LIVEENMSMAQVSRDLGIGQPTLDKWVRELRKHGLSAFPGKGHLSPEDALYSRFFLSSFHVDASAIPLRQILLSRTIEH
jgi:transposase-like protein